jgi:hypothetical protein
MTTVASTTTSAALFQMAPSISIQLPLSECPYPTPLQSCSQLNPPRSALHPTHPTSIHLHPASHLDPAADCTAAGSSSEAAPTLLLLLTSPMPTPTTEAAPTR